MPEDKLLEERVNEEKASEEKKPKENSLEKLVKHIPEIAATSALGLAIGGPLSLASVAATYGLVHLIENKKETTADGFAGELKTAGVMTAVLAGTYKFMNYAASLHTKLPFSPILGQITAVSAAVALLIPVFNAVYHPIDYLLKKHTISEMLFNVLKTPKKLAGYLKEAYEEKLKPEYVETTKNTYKLLPAVVANVMLVPESLQIATSSALRFFYRIMLGKKKEEPAKSYAPAHSPA